MWQEVLTTIGNACGKLNEALLLQVKALVLHMC